MNSVAYTVYLSQGPQYLTNLDLRLTILVYLFHFACAVVMRIAVNMYDL